MNSNGKSKSVEFFQYAFGDYSMIHAFLVAYNFSDTVIDCKKIAANRKYTIGRRPARTLEWSNLKLVKYSFNGVNKLDFKLYD